MNSVESILFLARTNIQTNKQTNITIEYKRCEIACTLYYSKVYTRSKEVLRAKTSSWAHCHGTYWNLLGKYIRFLYTMLASLLRCRSWHIRKRTTEGYEINHKYMSQTICMWIDVTIIELCFERLCHNSPIF